VSDPMGRVWLWHSSRLEQQEVVLLERTFGAAESAMARDKVPRATSCELRAARDICTALGSRHRLTEGRYLSV
jgi:hypothetical protein